MNDEKLLKLSILFELCKSLSVRVCFAIKIVFRTALQVFKVLESSQDFSNNARL